MPLDTYNTRGHTVKDLTTNEEILGLVQKSGKAKECAISKQQFREKQVKHWCWVCENFVNGENYRLEWVLLALGAS